MDEIAEFMSQDHDRIDGLLERFRAGTISPKEAQESLETFRCALEKHIEWEERVIFPAFENKTGSEGAVSTDALRLQHEEFRRQIEDLRKCSSADKQNERNLAEVLIESLKDHNYAEESFIYPWIDSVLELQEKKEILGRLQGTAKGGTQYGTQNIA